MIHSARPAVSPVPNIVLFEKWRMNGRHVQKQWSLPAVTVGRPSGSKSAEGVKQNFSSSFLSSHAQNLQKNEWLL